MKRASRIGCLSLIMSSFGLCKLFRRMKCKRLIGSVRQFVTLNLLRPFASWLGLKKAKLFRFLERKSDQICWNLADG